LQYFTFSNLITSFHDNSFPWGQIPWKVNRNIDLYNFNEIGQYNYGQFPFFADAESGDFHLKSQQGRWDAFSEQWVKDNVTSPGIDIGHPDDDYGNEPWPHGKRINAGAYGNTAEASLSVVSRGNPAEATGDDWVNYEDFSVFAEHWQTFKKPIRSDFDRDGSVGLQDLLTFSDNWLTLNIDPTLTVAGSVGENERISVDFADVPGNAGDWLGICQKGAGIDPWSGVMQQWFYTDGTQMGTAGITNGTVEFAGISEPGDYEVRLFFDDGYAIKDRRFFTVRGPGILNRSPESFSLALLEGISPPKSRTLTLMNDGGEPLDWSIDFKDGLPVWLSINPVGGTLASNQSQSVTLSFNIAGLLEGEYSYAFDIYTEDALDSLQEVQVNLNVIALPGDGAGGYYVSTAEQLVAIGTEQSLMDKRFELVNHIDLSEHTFNTAVIAAGTMVDGSFQGTPFTGQWDGKGCAIRQLRIDTAGQSKAYLGLFGYVDDAEIRNLIIENASITTGSDRSYNVGLLAGTITKSTVAGCFAGGQISAHSDHSVGGLAGSFGYGDISNCSTAVEIYGMHNVGGLLGATVRGNVSGCYSIGQVYGDSTVGGLIGYNNGANILNGYSASNVCGSSYFIGGLIGYNNVDSTVSTSYATGNVEGGSAVGGLIGECLRDSVVNCYATGTVSGNRDIGGLLGYTHECNVSNSYSVGSVSGNYRVGALIGYQSKLVIASCYFLDTVGPDNGYGEALTDIEIRQQASFVGWDFVNIWAIDEGFSYPKLNWQIIP